MVRSITQDKSLADDFDRHVNKRNIAHYLFGLRCSKGISQKQIAEHFGCSQSRISKLENSEDDDLRLGDLKKYLDALGMGMGMLIHQKRWKAMDQIKFHAFMIRDRLQEMAAAADKDEAAAEEAVHGHLETLINMVKIITESAKTLPNPECETPDILSANFDNGTTDPKPSGSNGSAQPAA